MARRDSGLYLFWTRCEVEAFIRGPYPDEESRDKDALVISKGYGEDAEIFQLTKARGRFRVVKYPWVFFDEESRGDRADSGLYLFLTWGDTVPEVLGPYSTEDARSEAALFTRKEFGAGVGIFKLTNTGQELRAEDYSGGFFDEGLGEDNYE